MHERNGVTLHTRNKRSRLMTNSFGKDIIPPSEQERIEALRNYDLLQDLPEGYFNNMAAIIANAFDVPIALVSLVRPEEVVFPGNVGMEDTTQAPRGISLCSLAILDDEPTVFVNALQEPCLLANPLVTGEFGLRFYAGAPILTADGHALGTVCVVDKEPRDFNEEEREMLKSFARTAMHEIEQRAKTLQTPV